MKTENAEQLVLVKSQESGESRLSEEGENGQDPALSKELLVSWIHDELEAATKGKCRCLADDDVQGYQFQDGYFKALHEVAKRIP